MGFWFFYYDEAGEWHWHWLFIGVWLALNVLPMWYVIYSNRRVKPNAKRDADYQPFVRLDYKNWSYVQGTIFGLFSMPRFLIGWGFFFVVAFAVAFAKWTKSDAQPMVGPRFWIVNQITRFGFRIALFMTGLVWAEKKQIKADYSKYLGKDYKYRHDRFGLQV